MTTRSGTHNLGLVRCDWARGDDYVAYHDVEWGRPVLDDRKLFEKLCLEGFQAGLSWLTILRKRDNFRAAFSSFDIETVASFGESDVQRLLGDSGIVRHKGKISAAINNARRALDIIAECGSLAAYIWSWEPETVPTTPQSIDDLHASTTESTALAKDLKRRGWRFVGPTTVYAFMQSVGMVNDHLLDCFARGECETERVNLIRP